MGEDTTIRGTIFALIDDATAAYHHRARDERSSSAWPARGILGIQYQPTGCDGSCHIGGAGMMVSPVARYMLRQAATNSVALIARAEVLALRSSTNCWSTCNGRATLFLVGLDFGFGFAPKPAPPPGPLIHAD